MYELWSYHDNGFIIDELRYIISSMTFIMIPRAIDEIRGPIAKNGLSGQNPKILAKKNVTLFDPNHVPATTG